MLPRLPRIRAGISAARFYRYVPEWFVLAGLLGAIPSGAATLVWNGAFSNSWRFNGGFPSTNWGGQLPSGADDILVFPAGGANKTMDNDLGDGLDVVQLRFTGAGYTLEGHSIDLVRHLASDTDPEIAVTHGAGTSAIAVDIKVLQRLPISVTNAAAVLELRAEADVNGSIVISGQGTVALGFIQDADFLAFFVVGDGTDSPTLDAGGTIHGGVRVEDGATLAGRTSIGESGASDLTMHGILAPGDPGGGPFGTAEIKVTGNVVFSSTAEYHCDLSSLQDKLTVAGDVVANSATIELLPDRPFSVGTVFTLIDKAGSAPIDSTPPFRLPNGAPINEGTEVNVGVNRFRFSYTGGGAPGNDLTARVVAAPSSGVREWDAGGTTRMMSEATNWSLNLLPVSSNTLRFGTAAPELPLAERFPVNDLGGNFYRLEFLSGGYALDEPAVSSLTDLTLTAGIVASHTSGGVSLDQDLLLAAAQTYSLTGAGFLRFGLNNTIDTEDFDLTVNNDDAGEMRFNGPIVDGGRLIKTGSGYVLMGGASVNTYTGGTSVMQGELRLARSSVNGAVPAGTLTIGGAGMSAHVTTTAAEQIADAAIVSVQVLGSLEPGALETIAALHLEGGNVGGTGVLAVAGNITALANAVITAPIQINGSVRDWDVDAGKTVQMNGALTVSPASTGVTMRKTGSGILRLTGPAANTTMLMDEGELRMDGPSPGTLSVSLRGGVLDGTGRVHEIIGTATGGQLSPGVPGATPLDSCGTLGCARLNLNAATRVNIDIAGTLAGVSFDQLSVAAGTSTGQVALNNAQLIFRQTTPVPAGSVLLIVDNDGTDAVVGTFAGLAQGALVSSTRNSYTISYTGGTGNDIVLTAIAAPEISVEFGPELLVDGSKFASLGEIPVGERVTGTFTIKNIGSSVLNLTGNPRVQVTNSDTAFFSIISQPAASVAAGGSTTFIAQFAPSFGGLRQASLVIPNNDNDEGPFNILIAAHALPVPVITAHTVTPPSGGNPGTVNLTIAGSTPNASMRLEGSSNLTSWSTLRTITIDAIGGAVTGVTNDPGSLTSPRRFYRVIMP